MSRKTSLLSLALMASVLSTPAFAQAKIASIFDLTGSLNIYGIQQNQALELAVEDINNNGGLLGEKVAVVAYDAQSEQSKFTQYANTAIMRDRVNAMFGGLTSSAREAIRPAVRKANIPYFYSALYEGGTCDKQTFVTGPTASQQLSVLIDWAVKKYGKKIYIMAPDYSFGTISAHWIHARGLFFAKNLDSLDPLCELFRMQFELTLLCAAKPTIRSRYLK